MKKVVLAVLALVLLVGCAPGLETYQKSVTVAGVSHQYVFAEGNGKFGAHLQVMNSYSPDGTKLETNNSFGSPGLWYSALHGAVAGAEMGAGIGAGLAVQGAAKVTQVGGGASSSASGGAGGLGGAGGAGGLGGAGGKATSSATAVSIGGFGGGPF